MQEVKIPLTIDPRKAAKMRSDYRGVVPGENLTRLMASTAGYCSDIHVRFSCDIDNQGLTVLRGTASGELSLICQRCLNAFNHAVEVEYCFTPVAEEPEDKELTDDHEPVVVDEHGHIEIHQLIEDELILSIPIVPMHDAVDCPITEQDMTVGEIDEVADKRPNPFAALERLKK